MTDPVDQLMQRLSQSVNAADSTESLVRPLLELLEGVTGLESTYLTRIDATGDQQHIVYARNAGAMCVPEGLSVPWGDTLCKRALDEGRMYTDNVAECWGDSDAARELGIRTYLSTPVRAEGGVLYGTLCGASDREVALPAGAENVLSLFARLIGMQLEREASMRALHSAYAELSMQALRDPVTGLPNRRAMLDELGRGLERVRREGAAMLVAYIDLDGFKAINDRHGHDAGDRFLAEVGARIAACLRASDLVARIGGDEFVVLAPVLRDAPEPAVVLRDRLMQTTRGTYFLGDAIVEYAGASVGVVQAEPEMKAQAVLTAADAAMYDVKKARQQQGEE